MKNYFTKNVHNHTLSANFLYSLPRKVKVEFLLLPPFIILKEDFNVFQFFVNSFTEIQFSRDSFSIFFHHSVPCYRTVLLLYPIYSSPPYHLLFVPEPCHHFFFQHFLIPILSSISFLINPYQLFEPQKGVFLRVGYAYPWGYMMSTTTRSTRAK